MSLYFGSVDGAQVRGNRFAGLPEGDHTILRDQEVNHVVAAADSRSAAVDTRGPDVHLTFSEWFGTRSEDVARHGKNPAELRGTAHGAGRLGGGLILDGKDASAVLRASPEAGGKPLTQFSLAMWVRSSSAERDLSQVLYSQADAVRGVALAIEKGRFIAGVWQDERACRLELGPALPETWQHVSLVFDGTAGTLRAFVNGIECATATENVPTQLHATTADAVFGVTTAPVRIGTHLPATSTNSAATAIDEFHLFSHALSFTEVCTLALRRSIE